MMPARMTILPIRLRDLGLERGCRGVEFSPSPASDRNGMINGMPPIGVGRLAFGIIGSTRVEG